MRNRWYSDLKPNCKPKLQFRDRVSIEKNGYTDNEINIYTGSWACGHWRQVDKKAMLKLLSCLSDGLDIELRGESQYDSESLIGIRHESSGVVFYTDDKGIGDTLIPLRKIPKMITYINIKCA